MKLTCEFDRAQYLTGQPAMDLSRDKNAEKMN